MNFRKLRRSLLIICPFSLNTKLIGIKIWSKGEYICKILNKHGSDITKGVLLMRTKRNIILDPQVPDNMSLESIRRLENRHVQQQEIAEEPIYPPKFLKPIESLNINESSIAHFETSESLVLIFYLISILS